MKTVMIAIAALTIIVGCKENVVTVEPTNDMYEIYTVLLKHYTGYIDSVESVTSFRYPIEYKQFVVALADIESSYTYHDWKNLRDMPEEFVYSFKSNKCTIYNYSQAYFDTLQSAYIIYYNYDRTHLRIISQPIYKTDSEVLIEYGSYFGPLGAEWGLYKLRKENGVWKISSYRPLWIS